MKIDTSELTVPALDWAVAASLGWKTYPTDSVERGMWYHTDPVIAPHGYEHNRIHQYAFTPSTDWSQGGPIIEQEQIAIECLHAASNDVRWQAWTPAPEQDNCEAYGVGPTPLIAAMRCYVASKLGDTVEIPDELC